GLSTRQAREFPPGLSADRPPPPDTANSRDCFTPEINGQGKIQVRKAKLFVSHFGTPGGVLTFSASSAP
ncbi:MAG: hypothetical protein WBO19_00575, partial [Terriglobia bacterium]